ncbi:SEC-C domain-containing protein [Paludibaculum fermentans]|uniref:SEC-C domain-containing protein n=1 Tax=Paludibaculum fermentans TaxID=1473598 RepID=UPI003EB99A12
MATAAQLTANRNNAQHSTGPRSDQGKARSARNNFRHGFRSQSVLLPGDDPAEYEELLAELTSHFDAQGLTEERYVREMADAEWRLRRVRAHQEVLLTARIAELAAQTPDADPIHLQAAAFQYLHQNSGFGVFLTYEAKFERQYERAYQGWLITREKLSRHSARQFHAQLDAVVRRPLPADEPKLPPVSLPQPAAKPLESDPAATPRNAPCPCGSGEKYKRCCGRHAPAVLSPGNLAA